MKPICEEHMREFVDPPGTVLCITCSKGRHQNEEDDQDEDQNRSSRRSSSGNDHMTPYFYGGYYYGSGYGQGGYLSASRHDPNDFTEADAESLSGGDMGQAFESDMSES